VDLTADQTIGGAKTFSLDVKAPSFTVNSDQRLKSDVRPISAAVASLMQLNPVSYTKRLSLLPNSESVKENGFIAQELQKVMPNLVSEGNTADKLLSVNYTALIPVLTKAVQEQQQVIVNQQKQIDELKALVNQLLNKKQ
jgi:hypothetical protein